ncbi:MAG: ABC transporter ATP-binding protein [Lachnospiraceae bacterium]|nr:ABC transporter ATP-binding protein [Lachnospiraceae bacterium]
MIQVKNLSAGYFGKTIVKNVTMDFVPGEVLVLLGPNGSGKTTLLKAALGLIPSMEGEILYDGVSMKQLSRKQIAQKAALLSQSRNTPSIQALRMVLHGRFPYLSYPRQYSEQDKEIARDAMKMTGSSPYEKMNVSELSGGQRQGVYLAMALAQDTETIFMDEPTTYLDISHQLQVMQTARNLANEGKAVVLVLHDLALALGGADKVAVFSGGAMRSCDTPEKIYESGMLNEVFHVEVHRVETPHGKQYYVTPSVL